MNILHVCANPKPTGESVSKQLAVSFFTTLADLSADFEVTNIDLYQNPPPYLSYEEYRGLYLPVFIDGYYPTDKEIKASNYAKEQGDLFNSADILVITTPMWNFSIPAILKAWIDQVITPGIAFNYTPKGPKPLHHIKHIVLLVASGGTYKEDDARDCLSSQLKTLFQYIVIDNINIAWADGQNPIFFKDCNIRKNLALEAVQEIAEEVAEIIKEGLSE
jgi:FMN-dependent NADH-azoreductase